MLNRIINKNTEYCRTASKKDGTSTMYGINKEDIEQFKKSESIYFVSWWDLSKKKEVFHRFKDHEIESKNYFAIDIDLRNNLKEKYDEEISNIDIVRTWLDLWKQLIYDHELFWQWSYIVFTWNGLHIYYVWNEYNFKPYQYKLWVKHIFKMWDEYVIKNWYDCLVSDHACCNLARILRLPGTINQKNGAKVRIISQQNINSDLLDKIKIYALIEAEESEIKNRIAVEEMSLKNYNSEWNEDYEKINSIPAYQIAQTLIPNFTFAKNGKNFNNNKKGFTGYYYVKETNTICNGGSRYFLFDWDENSCWNNFSIIKNWFWYTNRETFEWFKDKNII